MLYIVLMVGFNQSAYAFDEAASTGQVCITYTGELAATVSLRLDLMLLEESAFGTFFYLLQYYVRDVVPRSVVITPNLCCKVSNLRYTATNESHSWLILDSVCVALPCVFHYTEGVDFTASYDSVVAIDREVTMYCVDIFITDDSIVEGDEQFFFTLNSTSEGELIVFINRNTTITIRDDDGKHPFFQVKTVGGC